MDNMGPIVDSTSSHLSVDGAAGGSAGGQDDRAGSQSHKHGSSGSSGQPKFSNGPHIRSRITVVCAECKRLKLKCDRRTPCSSCLKRDTVPRCIYSQAAAEKIDVQSLHNRLLAVEETLSSLSTSTPSSSSSLSTALSSITPFKSSYPTPAFTQTSSGGFGQGSQSGLGNTHCGSGSVLAGLPCNDKALLAIGASGSSVVISLEDVSSLWVSELDTCLNTDSTGSGDSQFPPFSRPSSNGSGKAKVKLEPSPVLLPPSPHSYASNASTPGDSHQNMNMQPPAFIPPLPFTTFLPATTPTSDHSPGQSELPQVTPGLLQHLPGTPSTRSVLIRALSDTMTVHPCFNIRHFERRIEAMMSWGESPVNDPPPDDGRLKSKELARELFLGIQPSKKRKPTLSFFAAAAAAFALGVLVSNEPIDDALPSSASLYALSEQALGLFERTSPYDIDSLIAMLLQVLYQLHDGQMRIAQSVFPMVAKMVNVARMMGLGMDPDDFLGTYSLFDAETRRRVWWDIYCYDVFISDCMGQMPLIAEGSYTTKLPSDVDEQQFTSSSTSLVAPSEGDQVDRSFTFFILKCRLAQLVKGIRKQAYKDPITEDGSELSIDQVAASESDVTVWLSELPPRYRLEADPDLSQPTSLPSSPPALTAQRCVLAMTAARMILKLYLPFLKDAHSKPPHQALLGTISAAHKVISAARLLHAARKETLPAAFDFYDYGRTVFDAAVVCAHAVIQQPTSIMVTQAMQIVGAALNILHDLGGSRDDGPNDACKIVEMMRRKAELSKANGTCSDDANAGSKRKRVDSEENSFDSGLQLPFVGASVTSVKTDQARSMLAPSRPMTVPSSREVPSSSQKSSADSAAQSSLDDKKSKEKEKDRRYPPVGIRVRPGQSRPFNRQRTHSLSPNSSLVLSNGHAPSPGSVAAPQMDLSSMNSVANVQTPPEVPSFHPSPPSQVKENPSPPQPMPHDQYQLSDAQRYSHTFSSNSPPMASVYDQSANGASYPAAGDHIPSPYNPPQPSDGYGFYSPYPQATGTFDVTAQGMPLPEYGAPDAANSANAPPNHGYLLPSDKLVYPHQRGKTSDALGHDYHSQSQPSMPMMVQQSWQHPNPQAMWEYKYQS